MRGEIGAVSGMDEQKINVFHVCTKGLEDRLLFWDDDDYRFGIRIAAFSAFRHKVMIAAYCLMTNHVHFMVCADNRERVVCFLNDFKKEYSKYHCRRHGVPNVLKRVGSMIKQMNDVSYIRNCIAYILRNPVEGGLVRDAGQYEWSSVNCYFSGNASLLYRPVSSLLVKEAKRMLHTHCNLSGSGFMFDGNYDIVPESFVAGGFVESLFRNSREFFWNRVAKVDSAVMELELAFSGRIRYNDYELICRMENVVRERFNKTSVSQLDVNERCKMAGYLYRRMYAGASQIARVLGFDRKIIREILGLSGSLQAGKV